jgi:hypothetical protein
MPIKKKQASPEKKKSIVYQFLRYKLTEDTSDIKFGC